NGLRELRNRADIAGDNLRDVVLGLPSHTEDVSDALIHVFRYVEHGRVRSEGPAEYPQIRQPADIRVRKSLEDLRYERPRRIGLHLDVVAALLSREGRPIFRRWHLFSDEIG